MDPAPALACGPRYYTINPTSVENFLPLQKHWLQVCFISAQPQHLLLQYSSLEPSSFDFTLSTVSKPNLTVQHFVNKSFYLLFLSAVTRLGSVFFDTNEAKVAISQLQ